MDEPSHGHQYAHDISFGKTPDIKNFIHYIFWDPIYYYDTEKRFLEPRRKAGAGLDIIGIGGIPVPTEYL